jgi:SAM-dependent MidA family methyltransferase
MAANGGAALVIDYGHDATAFGDTLQAVRRHQFDDLLEAPGEADLTAHVDFTALATAASSAGAFVRPLMNQGEFLIRLGLSARVAKLAEGKDDATRRDIEKAATRLAGPQAMGRLFKVLAFSAPGLQLPAFD